MRAEDRPDAFPGSRGRLLASEGKKTVRPLDGPGNAFESKPARDVADRVGECPAKYIDSRLPPARIHSPSQIRRLGVVLRAGGFGYPITREEGIDGISEDVSDLPTRTLGVPVEEIPDGIAGTRDPPQRRAEETGV